MRTSPPAEQVKDEVRRFWEAGACGAKHASSAEGTPEFFAEVSAERDRLEPFIEQYADFLSTRDQRVLEVGVGAGSDFIRFVRAGAAATGVDLTERSIELVRRRLDLEGLDADLQVADAERLPFPDDSFDVVYSWGVLHHTPNPEAAFREVLRVTRPGGRLCVMVYGRHSWLAYGLWARHALLALKPTRTLTEVVANHMESVGTRAYTGPELRERFGALLDLGVEHVATPYDRRVAGPLARLTGNRFGWFVVVRGRAPGPVAATT